MKGLMIFGRVQNQFNLMGWYLQTTVSYSQRTLYPLDTSWSQEEMGEDDCFLWTGLSISAVDSWLPHFQAPQRIGWMVNFSFPFLFTVLKKKPTPTGEPDLIRWKQSLRGSMLSSNGVMIVHVPIVHLPPPFSFFFLFGVWVCVWVCVKWDRQTKCVGFDWVTAYLGSIHLTSSLTWSWGFECLRRLTVQLSQF